MGRLRDIPRDGGTLFQTETECSAMKRPNGAA
jgi:hypothetical protein